MILSNETIREVNQVFDTALSEGRETLYEHEVYQILRLIGLTVPEFVYCREPGEVTESLLKSFDSKIVVKIVSPQIAHKQKLGGVKIIQNNDPLYVQFVLNRMREEVLSHFTAGDSPTIEGFLIMEYIPYTQALGNEVLIGFKEDPAFGPVLTVSKGGDDAEFFAKYFDPANLFLPPFDYEAALKSLGELHIRHKFDQIGHPEYLEYMAQATAVISSLAEGYSIIHADRPQYIIKSFEVNPFVITLDNRFVAVDGFAQFVPAEKHAIHLPAVNPRNLTSFFKPRGIAVIGVSGDTSKYSLGREIAHLLHDLGRNDLYFVNAKGGTVTFGNREYRLYPRITDIKEPVELAVYAAPAQYMIDFVSDLAGTSVKTAILISGIPAEMKYQDFAAELTKVVPGELRLIGPNCMGVFAAPDPANPTENPGLNTLFLDECRLEVKASRYSNCVLLTQSGAFSVTAIDKMQHARVFQSIVSFGNKFDVKVTDLLAYFADLAGIDVLALYLEGLDPGEGRRFYQLARDIAKPVIVYKAGRTEAGAKAAASHTASMSGSYEVFQAACRQTGIILTENIGEQYDYIKAFSLLAKRIPTGNRIAGVVNAGFESTVGADELETLRQAQLSTATTQRLQEINKSGLVDTTTPFLDITPMADDGMYADFVEAVLQDEGVDCVFVAVVPHSPFLKTTPDTCRDEDSLANLLVKLNRRYQKPMVVSVNAGRYYQDFVSMMEENGLPVYTEIRSAIKSLDTFVSFHLQK
jgi:acyl-CoA synthetase (NDP forming)